MMKLNAFQLKILAVITMIIDHLGVLIFPNNIVFRIIGRVSFVLFAFLLVEGLYYTRNINRYFFRLLFFAIISEIPFDYVMYGEFFHWEVQNVFWNLAIGVGSIGLLKNATEGMEIRKLIICVLSLFLAAVIKADFSWYGLMVIYIFFFWREKVWKLVGVGFINIIIGGIQTFGFLGVIPILFYSGKQGRRMGWWFYSFYAVHLIILKIIKNTP